MKKQLSVLAGTCALVGTVGSTLFAAKENQRVAEFGAGEADRLEWRIVNDGVMGGLSKGNISFTDGGTMVFKGNLSLENNGGFSSVRTGV